MKKMVIRLLGLATIVALNIAISYADPTMACCTHGQAMACCTHGQQMACCGVHK